MLLLHPLPAGGGMIEERGLGGNWRWIGSDVYLATKTSEGPEKD